MKVTRKLPKYPLEEEHEEAKNYVGPTQQDKSAQQDKDIEQYFQAPPMKHPFSNSLLDF